MKIKITKHTDIDIVVGYENGDEDEPIFEEAIMQKDEVYDVEKLSEGEGFINIQFADGDCCYGLSTDCFEIIEDEE